MSKAALKAAKSALDKQDWDTAIEQSQTVLSTDPQNYFAKLFLGRAYEKQGNLDSAAETYHSAATFKPEDTQAWLGLCSVYESQGKKNLDKYREAAVQAAQIFGRDGDLHRAQSLIDKLVDFTKLHGTQAQQKEVLRILLPGTPIYEYLEGRIPHPASTYIRLTEITEEEESRIISKEVSERRTRIGARLGQVTLDVKREVYGRSDLEELYQQVINWTNDDEVRREYEEKLLKRSADILDVLPLEQKPARLDEVLNLAEGMVIIQHPFQLAWDLVLESRDVDDLRELDVNTLTLYIASFPESGVAKVLKAWLGSEVSPFSAPAQDKPKSEESDTEALTPEDRLLLMTDGLADAEPSPLAHRIVGEYYLYLEEYQIASETARAGFKAAATKSSALGLTLQHTKDSLNSVLGTALVHYEAPRNHVEAKRLFTDILQRKPKSTSALIGLGLIYEETEDYQEAIEFLSRALAEDEGNIRVGVELAWCRALSHDYSLAVKELEDWLELVKANDPRTKDLRAQTLYRIGVCLWNSNPSKASRKDRNGPYARFLAAIKTNVNFAPAYTSLGVYYSDYAKDKKRARQCYQKAFELSSAEVEAAERLARSFADHGDWDIVEVIAQRVVDSGRTRPPPGSKKKGISWPYSALGIVQMNKQDYQQAIVSFLAALRINPEDYESYVGLGESYQNSGRYNSAMRTFDHALAIRDADQKKTAGEIWFARYMLANVHRELGDFDEAVEGLRGVLADRPTEFGVLLSLLQTYVERSWRCIETGQFMQAVQSSKDAFVTATQIAEDRPHAFNVWKAVGDACSTFLYVQSAAKDFPSEQLEALLEISAEPEMYKPLSELDEMSMDAMKSAEQGLMKPLMSAILAYKRATHSCSHDIHAQAVSWYNLGWIEQFAYLRIQEESGKKHLKAAVRCFKRAIELEAGNAEFWNALGVATTALNPRVAQHSFVRSLHLNELNAKVWTNLGVLYLLQNDIELAEQAFGRAQSTDPEYGHAWVGQGLIAVLTGHAKEAFNHFTHAFEISSSSSIIVKQEYAVSSFDHLLADSSTSKDLSKLIQPMFALQQLSKQAINKPPLDHLSALLFEREGNHAAAIETLDQLCVAAEADYEATESSSALARFALAKSDLARDQLAAAAYADAVENAETALDLSSDADNSGLDAEARRKLRLSCHLTAGLAHYNLQKMQESIVMFRAALQESGSDPDVVCSLVQVLWAQGGQEEKSVAREQLFDCVEKFPENVGAVSLLGAIAALDDDVDTATAVRDDLLTLRTKDGLRESESADIDALLLALAGLLDKETDKEAVLTDAQSAILLKPSLAQGWTELAELSDEASAAEMALQTTSQAVPPLGERNAVDLAEAFAGIGTAGDAQRAIALAPWHQAGWELMNDSLAS